ncbi:MAG: glycosyltransferase family 4 protein [Planctomycetota bacterium]
MTRLLLFVTDLKPGGTPTVVKELATRLPTDDLHVEVACLGGMDAVATELVDAGVDVTAFDVGVLGLPHAVARLGRLVDEHEIDVVLSLLVHANTVAAIASRGRPGVRWWQSIQTTQPRPRWHWPVQRWAAKHATGVIVPSPSVADVARSRAGVAADRVHVIPNGVDEATVVDQPKPARDAGSPLCVVFFGRFDPVKRVPMLIDAVRQVENVTLDVFGDGPERSRIEQAASGSNRVHIHGWADKDVALADADVLVLPSEAEGFGLVLIEAMAAGVPVIGADAPGIRDVIRHDDTGLLFDLAGARRPTLTETLSQARDEAALLHRLSDQALRWVRTERLWTSVIERYRMRLVNQ